MTSLGRSPLRSLSEIRYAQFDGKPAPCSRKVLLLLERLGFVRRAEKYAVLTELGWTVVTAYDQLEMDEATVFTDRGRLRILVPRPVPPIFNLS